MAPPNVTFRFDPAKHTSKSPEQFLYGIGHFENFTTDNTGKRTYNMRYDGKLPETAAEIAECVKAARVFMNEHRVSILPRPLGEKALIAALTKSFQHGGVMYEKLASRVYTIGTILDLSRDADMVKAVPTSITTTPANDGPMIDELKAPTRAGPAVTFDLSKLDAKGREQAAAYTKVRKWIDAKIAEIEGKPATVELAISHRILRQLRERCDRSANELSSGHKTYAIRNLDLLEGPSQRKKTPADESVETMYHIVCIAGRIDGLKEPENEAARLISPGSRDPLGQPEFYVSTPWLSDTLLDRLLPGYKPFHFTVEDVQRLQRNRERDAVTSK